MIQSEGNYLLNLERQLQKERRLLRKDIYFGSPIGDELDPQDDFFLLQHFGFQNFKVSKVEVFEGEYKQVAAIRFTYTQYRDTNTNNLKEITGHLIGNKSVNLKEARKKEEITLYDGEFLTSITSFIDSAIDQITITTNKDRSIHSGSRNKGEKALPTQYNAPEGFHYTCFSGMMSEHWQGLSLLNAEISSIDVFDTNEQSCALKTLLSHKSIIRSLIPFLTVKELSHLMRSYKKFAKILQNDRVFIDEIGRRGLFSGNQNLMQYYQSLKQNPNLNIEQEETGSLKAYENNLYNYVENPHGEQGFKGYLFQDGYGHNSQQKPTFIENLNGLTHFKFTHYKTTLLWSRYINEIFSSEDITNIVKGDVAIVFGLETADSNYGGSLNIKVQITDQENNIIFCVTRDFPTVQRSFKFFNIAGFINNGNDQTLKSSQISFSITGVDSRFWAGHFGPRVRSITCRLLPVETEHEQKLFQYCFRDNQ